MNMYLPNEATAIMNLLGMKTNTQPKKARASNCATALAVTPSQKQIKTDWGIMSENEIEQEFRL